MPNSRASNKKDSGFDVGNRLRTLRNSRGLSQRALADRAGVSNAVISLIEQNKTNPSIGLLKKILDGILVSLADFFSNHHDPHEQCFFTAAELVEIGGGKISYRQVGHNLANHSLQILHEHYAPGADTGENLLRHEAEEGGIVLRGQLEVTVGGERQMLGPGDAYYFNSRQPHRFRNVGKAEAEVFSACTPANF